MSLLFETHRMNVSSNQIKKNANKQPVSGYTEIATNIPCRLTGTTNNDVKLFVHATHLKKIPEGIHKNYIIEVIGVLQKYEVVQEPIWAAGVKHHIEVQLQEKV